MIDSAKSVIDAIYETVDAVLEDEITMTISPSQNSTAEVLMLIGQHGDNQRH
jgi:hypothetical protein